MANKRKAKNNKEISIKSISNGDGLILFTGSRVKSKFLSLSDNVGIGTSNPIANLIVNNKTRKKKAAIQPRSNEKENLIHVIHMSGRVGIGTPDRKLIANKPNKNKKAKRSYKKKSR